MSLKYTATLIAADGSPSTLPFVSLDNRLIAAARQEGFPVSS
jgi:hypothetical protein